MESNEVLDKLPRHLLGLVIDQPYNEYTSLDHAIWRYVMHRNVRHLSKVAHGSYTDGLKRTGISIDSIPHMYGMNRILREIGWAAVAVDGFIPPSAFMEFQAYNVLVIAADIRPLDQIEYTPAPDIIHEAAGHAPIIADPEYARHLSFFGEIGSKAFSSAHDYEMYEAIRHLSILKADPYTKPEAISNAEARLALLEKNLGQPSEMALIRNLHWWTVEYGLIGTPDDFKIYGAGLLSSIGESQNCLKPAVKKLPYTIDAVNYNFDITTQQPQLFVTPDFGHLDVVLNEFADQMALRRGGAIAVHRAETSGNTATVQLDSGLQISGTFRDCIYNDGELVYIRTTGPSALSAGNRELNMHGRRFHSSGYSTPAGKTRTGGLLLHLMSEEELELAGFVPGVHQEIEFFSGVTVKGTLDYVLRHENTNLIFGFIHCMVTYKDQVLFDPSMGRYDMALGSAVTSAWPGPADPEAFGFTFPAPAERTHKIVYDQQAIELHNQYSHVRELRKGRPSADELRVVSNKILSAPKTDWLLLLELHELLKNNSVKEELTRPVLERLGQMKTADTSLTNLIDDGIELFA